jgi:hypothetical protein
LEGGYDVGALAGSMAALMPVLVGFESPAAVEIDVHPLAEAALARLAPYFPDVAPATA